MIHPSPIIAVDDNPRELSEIVRALRSLDAACLPVTINGTNPDILSPLRGVRLVFFDINYLPGVPEGTAMFETAATVLSKVLAKDNGPYVLITWTTKSDQHENLMRYFSDIEELPTPAVTGTLAKERFTTASTATEGDDNTQSLAQEINSILSLHPQVQALMHWEASARRAAGDVASSLLDLLPRDARFLGSSGPGLQNILTHVAGSAVGAANIAQDRRAAISEALTPILYDRMVHQTATPDETSAWAKAISLEGRPTPIVPHPGPKLNALSHLALPASGPMDAGDRGVVFELAGGTLEWFVAKAAIALEELAATYVVFGAAGAPPTQEQLSNCRWVLIGTRAVCDQAQRRGILRPSVLALEVPSDMNDRGSELKLKKHGATTITPSYLMADPQGTERLRKLVINWHWSVSLGPSELQDATVLFRLREPLINMLAAAMSGYNSRPGIISFD